MAINPALLIAAPMLQDYFVDNVTAQAMSGGIITCFQDNSRTTLKNWYYQSGTPGNYTYIPLPNPLTLSAVGTITDANGNDTIPFFYPFSETDNQTPQPYYITVVDSNLQLQFTRANFPYITNGMVPGTQTSTLQNYIINNNFWRNIGTLNAQNVTQQIVCPSQHDGYTNGDIQFIKSVTGATETITFTKFGLGVTPLIGDITPEYYINHNCTALQGGETQKCYQFPISLHVKTLESQQATVTIQAQSVGSGANNISLYIYQFTGTGTSSPAPILIQELTLTNNWQKFTIPFTFPSAAGATLGNGGDDALFLQVQMPLSATFDINFCLPSLYLGSTVPTDNFSTYDQDNSIISSSRTGDVRASMNSFYYFGWVPMNNGTLGNPSSNATARANVDSWPLFNLLWGYAKAYDSGSNNNPICQMYTSAGSNTNFGGSAISDFNANNQLALTQMFGQVLMGTVPISALLSSETSAITASNSGGNILITPTTTISLLYVGMPVTFTTTGSLPGNIVANAIYYVCNISGGTFNISTSFSNALSGTVVAFSSAGSNSTVYTNTTAKIIGEYQHTLTISEMPSHTHQIPNFGVTNAAASPGVNAASAGSQNTGSTGGGNSHNTIQPSVGYNIYMKL